MCSSSPGESRDGGRDWDGACCTGPVIVVKTKWRTRLYLLGNLFYQPHLWFGAAGYDQHDKISIKIAEISFPLRPGFAPPQKWEDEEIIQAEARSRATAERSHFLWVMLMELLSEQRTRVFPERSYTMLLGKSLAWPPPPPHLVPQGCDGSWFGTK